MIYFLFDVGSLWFDFEVAVAALSGLCFIFSLVSMIVISVALRTLKQIKKVKVRTGFIYFYT